MIYSVHLYTVDIAHVSVFMAAFRRGGLWTDIARLQPGYIHTDLLQSASDGSRFMSIQFWSSIQSLLAARRSPEVRSFVRWLACQAIDHEDNGMFVFPVQPNSADSALDDLTSPSLSPIVVRSPDASKEVHP